MVRPIIFTLTGSEFLLDGKFSEEYTNKTILIRAYKPMTLIHIKNINCKTILFQRFESVDSLTLENILVKRLGKFLYKYQIGKINFINIRCERFNFETNFIQKLSRKCADYRKFKYIDVYNNFNGPPMNLYFERCIFEKAYLRELNIQKIEIKDSLFIDVNNDSLFTKSEDLEFIDYDTLVALHIFNPLDLLIAIYGEEGVKKIEQKTYECPYEFIEFY